MTKGEQVLGKETYYITTPIYYPSDRLHIGHAYTTVFCDAVARWRRFSGDEVFFLTGSDEHGLKVQRAAQAKGKDPKTHVDEIVATFKELWRRLDISYDDFIRTTEPRHEKVVQHIFQKLYDQGDIYKGSYDGWYCTPCESFWPESKLADGNCPDCGRPVEWVEEESYFFRMSRYADRLLAHIEAHPEFIQPESRRNEMISFIRGGLEDLSVSRTTFQWGIPVPFDPKHVTYVWIDALTNYLTGIGYLQDEAKYQKWWPADCHVVGKDILRFHTVIWPAILLAAGIPLPKQVYAHGWLLSDTGKMSKSKGNVVDPNRLIDHFGADAIRYFLLREVTFGQDARYNTQALVERINSDLANDLGNSLHRSVAMLGRFCGGVIPEPGDPEPRDLALRELAERTRTAVDEGVRSLHLSQALIDLWQLVRAVNKYIDESEPWALAREKQTGRLATVMYHVFEALRIVGLLVSPFLPRTGAKILEQLGIERPLSEFTFGDTAWGGTVPGVGAKGGDPIFPRLDVDETLDRLAAENERLEAAAAPKAPDTSSKLPSHGDPSDLRAKSAFNNGGGKTSGESQPPGRPKAEDALKTKDEFKAKETKQVAEESGLISIEEFGKVQLRLAKVLEAGRVEGADKLLKLKVDLGGETRQIVAGIAKHYEPQSLVGKLIVVVANLRPAKLRGEVSQGMLLAASDENGNLALVTVEKELPPGSTVR